MPPKAQAVNCVVCERKPGRLGKYPNKYCYGVACFDTGVSRGHIKSSKRPAGCGYGGSSGIATSPGPTPMQMGRDLDAQVPVIAEISDLKEILGLR